jgi:hypothetical protein
MRRPNFTDAKFPPPRLKRRLTGSKKCENQCGRTISANKVVCMTCFTKLSEEAAREKPVARTENTEPVESVETSANL